MLLVDVSKQVLPDEGGLRHHKHTAYYIQTNAQWLRKDPYRRSQRGKREREREREREG